MRGWDREAMREGKGGKIASDGGQAFPLCTGRTVLKGVCVCEVLGDVIHRPLVSLSGPRLRHLAGPPERSRGQRAQVQKDCRYSCLPPGLVYFYFSMVVFSALFCFCAQVPLKDAFRGCGCGH